MNDKINVLTKHGETRVKTEGIRYFSEPIWGSGNKLTFYQTLQQVSFYKLEFTGYLIGAAIKLRQHLPLPHNAPQGDNQPSCGLALMYTVTVPFQELPYWLGLISDNALTTNSTAVLG